MYTTSLGEMVQQLVGTQYVKEIEEKNAEKISWISSFYASFWGSVP